MPGIIVSQSSLWYFVSACRDNFAGKNIVTQDDATPSQAVVLCRGAERELRVPVARLREERRRSVRARCKPRGPVLNSQTHDNYTTRWNSRPYFLFHRTTCCTYFAYCSEYLHSVHVLALIARLKCNRSPMPLSRLLGIVLTRWLAMRV